MLSIFGKAESTRLLPPFLWILFIFHIMLFSSHVAAGFLTTAEDGEANALLSWKASFDIKSRARLSSWSAGKSPCRSWYGIKCDESNSIIEIKLNDSRLSGPLHTLNFSSFGSLSIFNISYNSFYGNIPHQIGTLSKLTHLILKYNSLCGAIPSEITNLTSVIGLDFPCNFLNGTIPREIGALKTLDFLDFSNNSLSGSIPPSIGNLSHLKMLYIHSNNLVGSLPEELGKLHSLVIIQLIKNKLSGPIPPSIGHLANLEELDIDVNALSGSIPSSIANITKLKYLNLFENNFSGSIPREINNLTNLVKFNIGDNNLVGHLPENICLGRSLEKFSVRNNRFIGLVPRSLKNCTSLIRIRLEQNQLTGNITDVFGVYPYLEYFDMSHNKFYGHLSPKWGQCHKLGTFNISKNNLSGRVPPELGKAANLQKLDLSSNHLTGNIPREFGNLNLLNTLSMSNNQLSGHIPIEIGSLHELQELELSANNLSGSIPTQLGGLGKLLHLILRKNRLEESIPSEFGRLQTLRNLDLSGNLLSGKIPATLGELKYLETLNLSRNNLSGTIPYSFADMLSLAPTSIDISFNQLDGSLPNNQAFLKAPIEALQNNAGLCGNIPGLVACNNYNAQGGKSIKLKVLIPVLVTVVALVSVIAVLGLLYIPRKSVKDTENQASKEKPRDLFAIWSYDGKIVYENIIEATEGFDDKYLIGLGGYGNVYKAELPTGQVVAVKKLHGVPDGDVSSEKAFRSEIQALTSIRHRNIVKLYGYCSHPKFLFLVYEFLEGGSLDKILHDEAQAIGFDWNKRVKVIKDVANGLSYMHHNCSPPIIHRDISSKNILFNSEFDAHICDFGTARLLMLDSHTCTSFAGTVGYSAPELAYAIKIDEKCDVYSFGVLVLEMLLGKHPGDLISSLSPSPLVSKASIADSLPLKDVLDSRLRSPTNSVAKEVMMISKIAFACLTKSPRDRPTMEQVCNQLMTLKLPSLDEFYTTTLGQLHLND